MEFEEHIQSSLSNIEKIMQEDLAAEDKNVYGLLAPFISRGGKRIRPALALLCASALGADPKEVERPAAIIELFHNFTLIHDDIEDNSQFRRGVPTLHISHSIPMALNSGDALYTLIWKKIISLDLQCEKLLELQRLYTNGFKTVVDGQGTEIAWIHEDKFNVTEEEYLNMIAGKTAALIGLSCEMGAFLANSEYRKEMKSYGEKIGIAFQIHDDVLNVTGNFEKYRKEIGGDITEGKRTLMVVHALHSNKKNRLIEILKKHSCDPEEINEAISILKETGSIDYAREYSKRLVEDAKKDLQEIPDSKDKKSLMRIADYVIGREL
ncbi:polyprenyl synthetase family protein [Candidatus Micrarchaeota archaeon]|nr:polyprenyl synthetase family protein [Candidatus Micrarchaeota archaeon]